MTAREPARFEPEHLTPREAEVLRLVGERFSNTEIAERLTISKRTVESHIAALMRKLSMHDRSGLIRAAQAMPPPPLHPEQVMPLAAARARAAAARARARELHQQVAELYQRLGR